jgi:hypothetical protein
MALSLERSIYYKIDQVWTSFCCEESGQIKNWLVGQPHVTARLKIIADAEGIRVRCCRIKTVGRAWGGFGSSLAAPISSTYHLHPACSRQESTIKVSGHPLRIHYS